jgi:hypothetical protein
VDVEFSYQGTRMHGAGGSASGQDGVHIGANYFATYGGHEIAITSVRITGVTRAD